MGYDDVTLEKDSRIATIVLGRLQEISAINDALFAELEAALNEVLWGTTIRMVVIKVF